MFFRHCERSEAIRNIEFQWIASGDCPTNDKSLFRHCELAKQSSERQSIISTSGLLRASQRRATRIVISDRLIANHSHSQRRKQSNTGLLRQQVVY